MDDDARALLKHLRQERPIQPHRWKQILVECALPFGVIECGEASAGSGRTADDMNNNVDAAKPLRHGIDDGGAAIGRRDIGGDKQVVRRKRIGPCPR